MDKTESVVMPKASVIVPVYNVEKYLEECLDSIMNQTYQDFELILIDDGSEDLSGKICDEYAKKYDNIMVIHQENQGQAAARNNGVKIARAEWVMFVDSDDVIHQDLLKFLFESVMSSNSRMAVANRIKSEVIPKDFFKNYSFVYKTDDVDAKMLENYFDAKDYFYWAPFPSLINKKVLETIPFPEGRIYEDNAIGCQLLFKAEKISRIPHVMYWYRENPSGTMNLPLTEKKLDYLWALETQIAFFERINSKSMCRKITNELFETTFYYYDYAIKEDNDYLIIVIRKKLKAYLNQYKCYISEDKRFSRKTDRIICPKIYRIKKFLKIY